MQRVRRQRRMAVDPIANQEVQDERVVTIREDIRLDAEPVAEQGEDSHGPRVEGMVRGMAKVHGLDGAYDTCQGETPDESLGAIRVCGKDQHDPTKGDEG